MEIGYLGPKCSYSEDVASAIKSTIIKNGKCLPFDTIPKLLASILEKKVEKIILPIENSIEGIVTDSIDILIANYDNEFTIEGEYILQVKHCLAGTGKEKNVKKIISHPQALAQCANFVRLTGAETGVANSTSEAAKIVAERQNSSLGAICNVKAADFYGLKVFRKQIGDNPNNSTRFFLIGHEIQEPTEKDKTSIIFQTKNKPGALAKIIQIFEVLGINMTQIQSRPSKIKLGDYVFFVEIEGHQDKECINVALKLIKEKSNSSLVLGSYPKLWPVS